MKIPASYLAVYLAVSAMVVFPCSKERKKKKKATDTLTISTNIIGRGNNPCGSAPPSTVDHTTNDVSDQGHNGNHNHDDGNSVNGRLDTLQINDARINAILYKGDQKPDFIVVNGKSCHVKTNGHFDYATVEGTDMPVFLDNKDDNLVDSAEGVHSYDVNNNDYAGPSAPQYPHSSGKAAFMEVGGARIPVFLYKDSQKPKVVVIYGKHHPVYNNGYYDYISTAEFNIIPMDRLVDMLVFPDKKSDSDAVQEEKYWVTLNHGKEITVNDPLEVAWNIEPHDQTDIEMFQIDIISMDGYEGLDKTCEPPRIYHTFEEGLPNAGQYYLTVTVVCKSPETPPLAQGFEFTVNSND